MASENHTPDQGVTSDIHVHMPGLGIVHFYGTWQQLIDEGLIEAGELAPKTCSFRVTRGYSEMFFERKWIPGSRKAGRSGVKLSESNWWQVSVFRKDVVRETAVSRRRAELQEAIYAESAEGRRQQHMLINSVMKAWADEDFQVFLKRVLPTKAKKT